jgi:signal transduction histidine kinase
VSALFRLATLGSCGWQSALPQIVEADARVIGCERVGYWSLSEATGTIRCECNYTSSLATFERGLVLDEHEHPRYFAEIRRARIITSDDVRSDARLAGLEDYFRARAITRLMDVPVWAGGHLAGVICHEQAEGGHPWSHGDEQFALGVAQVVSTTLENRARTRAEQSEFRSRFLSDVTGVLSSTLDVQEAARRAARIALPALGEACHIDLLDGDGARRVAIAATDPEREERLEEMSRRFPPTPGGPHFTMWAGRRREAIIVPDVDPEHVAAYGFEGAQLECVMRANALPRSLMAVPLLVQGRVLGGAVMCTYSRRFSLDDLRLAEEFADRVAAVLANAQLYAQAMEAIRARDEFIAIASHELRTPLTSLTLATDTLSRQLVSGSTDRVTRAADAIARQTRRLNELVERMLDVARSGGGRLVLQREPVDLAQLVRDVARNFAPALERTGSPLELRVGSSVRGRWDGHRLQQVVGNLLDNAIKFGKGKPIEVSLEEVGDRAVLTVRDHGVGIPAERLSFVFNRFERAVTAREFGGLGLGLYITRLIVEAHGGTIRVESRPEEGATFVVELPGAGDPG